MKVIYKYPIPDSNPIEMPIGAKILSLHLQRGVPTIWALVDPDNKKEIRKFIGIGTGHPKPDDQIDNTTFIGTLLFDDDNFVYHFFEEK